MSIIVNNTDNQLNISINGVLDVYNVKTIKSVSRGVDASGNYYIAINFIANDKNNSLRINLSEVSSPAGWTNDVTGANAAIADIRNWLSEIVEVQISEANDSILVYGWDGTTNRKIKTDANGELQVDVLTTPGTFAEDSAHVSGNTGSFVMGVRNDTDSVLTSNNGDYSPISVSNTGALKISSGPGFIKIPGALRPNNTSGNLNTVADTFFSVSVANVGSADGTILSPSITIKPGEVLNFSADALNNYFTSFPYDATGTEFIIIYVTD